MNAWSREDIIIAYALYCVTPLGKIKPSHSAGRFYRNAHEELPVYRPEGFLRDVAKADRMIYEEFKHDWGSLSLEAETLTGLAIFDSSPLQGAKPLSSLTNHGNDTSSSRRCFISGCALPQMLVASHIKPYSQCRSEADRVSPDNGICLNTIKPSTEAL